MLSVNLQAVYKASPLGENNVRYLTVRGVLDQRNGEKTEKLRECCNIKTAQRWQERKGEQTESNTNNSGWISPAIFKGLSWLSCCLLPEACTWVKETHLDKERRNRDRGTQHKYTSSWGGGGKGGGESRQRTSSTISALCKICGKGINIS